MEATVIKLLNRRVGSPSVNAPKLLPLEVGSAIEIVQTLKGDKVDGNDLWFKTEEGYFVWSGGVKTNENIENIYSYKQVISNLNNQWIETNGKNTTIVVIDSGILIDKTYFNPNLINQIDLLSNNNGDNVSCHATFIGGIIAATNKIIGIAIEANITSIKYKDSNSDLNTTINNLKAALDTIKTIRNESSNLPIIVNISQGFNSYQTSLFPLKIKEIKDLIMELAKLNIIFLCSAGENKQLDEKNILFPASLEDTIAIGCISQDFANMQFSKSIDIVMPFVPFKSFNNNFEVVEDVGSSFSTALMTGIISLMISYKSSIGLNRYSKFEIMNELAYNRSNISDFDYNKLVISQFFVNKN